MKNKHILTCMILAGAMAACQSPENIAVADYCADPDKVWDNVCQLNVEINGTKTALANTDLKLNEARSIASSALSAAGRAQASADSAQATANEARSIASTALASIDDLHCETLTINKTDTGTCPANFRLMSCSQTRYTHRAGGLSFLREINDETCRFNSRVLEMKVRCCTVAQNRRQITYSTPVSRAPNVQPVATTTRHSGVTYTPLSSGS